MSNQQNSEKFKTTIGGQALIEGIMMRGPKKDAVVIRGKDGLAVEVSDRKLVPEKSYKKWPFLRGIFSFFDSQVTGVKALMRSADLAPEEYAEEEKPSKLDLWLEKKLGSEKFQQFVIGFAVFLGLAMSIGLFFVLPGLISGVVEYFLPNELDELVQNLLEGLIRMCIFMGYMLLVSRMKEMRRVFAYHGAEHKTIRCYEACLPLTVENVRQQTRLHPRCGTSFLLVVMVISILVFTIASSALLKILPDLADLQGTFAYRLIMVAYKLLLLPLVVGITYELNRWIGRHDNALARILSAPGMWMQNFTTNEPDDSMIEVAITALQAVLPDKEGEDTW